MVTHVTAQISTSTSTPQISPHSKAVLWSWPLVTKGQSVSFSQAAVPRGSQASPKPPPRPAAPPSRSPPVALSGDPAPPAPPVPRLSPSSSSVHPDATPRASAAIDPRIQASLMRIEANVAEPAGAPSFPHYGALDAGDRASPYPRA